MSHGDKEFVAVFDGTTGSVVIIFNDVVSYRTGLDATRRRFESSPPWLPPTARDELERRLLGVP